jgi:hypothetical protein
MLESLLVQLQDWVADADLVALHRIWFWLRFFSALSVEESDCT